MPDPLESLLTALSEQMPELIAAMDPAKREDLEQMVQQVNGHRKFIPTPGPQSEAYYSKADVLLYGGQAGGGKSALGLGLALTQHTNSLVMRKRFNDLSALTKECIRFCKTRDGFSQSPRPKMNTDDGRAIDFGAAQHVGDEESYQGHPYDFLYLDEASQFLESQVRFLMGWNRTTGDNPGQRCRVVLGSNPPLTSEGDWMVDMFAPWLDPTYPNPAKAGELRWVISDEDGKDRWVDGPEAVYVGGRFVKPLSRTFVPASLKDNPFLANTGYDAKLDAMPEPLRSAMRDGNFMTARMDADDQVIPTAWVIEAQNRWKESPEPPLEVPMCAMGIDPAKGGGDETAIAPRYNHWYAPIIVVPGRETPTGPDSAALIIKHRRHNAVVVVDVGGGYGDSCFDVLKSNLQNPQSMNKVVVRFDGAAPSTAKTTGGTLPFLNKRAEAWWRFREALDPGQEGGSQICLPPDPKLMADLTAPRLDKNVLTLGKIKIEGKPELKQRLGRSPDRGDAVVMAWSEGNHAITHASIWRAAAKQGDRSNRPKVVMGYEGRRR